MAGPYYIDIGTIGAFNTRDGLSTGACWYGTAGLQHMFNTVSAGEIAYIKGTADIAKWYTVAYDAPSGNLTNGEAVSWTGGTGVVTFAGTMATPVKIELSSGTAPTDNLVITGTTSGSTITQNGAPTRVAISVNTKSGTNAAGFIKYIGCNSSWTVDGTRFVIDVNSVDQYGILSTDQDLLWFQNIEVKNAGGSGKHGIYHTGASGSVVINGSFHNNSGNGVNVSGDEYVSYMQCAFYSNTGHGIYGVSSRSRAYFCSFHDNASDNVSAMNGMVYGSIVYDAGDDNIDGASFHLINCVIDGKNTSMDDGIYVAANTSLAASTILGCRITNHSGSGDIGLNCNSEIVITGWNYFENNDGANIQNGTLHYFIPNLDNTTTNIEDQSNTNQGYTSLTNDAQDYNPRTDASLRRTAITIPIT